VAAVVLERRRLPLDKACGEGLMPPGVAALAAMGVEVPASERAPFIGIRWVDGEIVAEGRFRDRPGWGVRRTALVEGMVARARALGVELRYGCAVRSWHREGRGEIALDTDAGPLRARLLVGADGLRSRVRREAGLAGRAGAGRRFGIRRHFRVAPWSPFVEVHWHHRAEAYVTPVGPDRVGVALLWDGSGGGFADLLGRFPALRERLEGATVETDARGAGPFEQRVRRRYTAGVALVGDAAGYLDALTGEGLTLAFHAAEALAETVARGRHLRDYEAAYRRLSRTYYRATGLLLHVARRPWLRRRVVRALARDPRLFDRLLAVSTGEPARAALGVGGVLRTIAGVLG
jgi:flavin-dependent dehydrogenase